MDIKFPNARRITDKPGHCWSGNGENGGEGVERTCGGNTEVGDEESENGGRRQTMNERGRGLKRLQGAADFIGE